MTAPTPVRASEILQRVLDRDERLIDIIARHSPQLAKLRNSPMRRIMAKVTTVAQAARLCGIPADALVQELNEALGLGSSAHSGNAVAAEATGQFAVRAATANAKPAPAWTRQHARELDVRDDLRNGREPFSRIMAAIATLEDASVLRLKTTFEPVPLLALLARRGFAHFAEQQGAEDWVVWFRRSSADRGENLDEPEVSSGQRVLGGTEASRTEVHLDVRGLEPPEPMVRTLEALESLPAACALVHVNVRVPQLLLPILRERGFQFEIHVPVAGEVHVRIWRELSSMEQSMTDQHANPAATSSPRELDVRPIPPREKHPAIFGTLDTLKPGESLLLINDHDPRPLRYQLDAERSGAFAWTYEEEGPLVWRVRIVRM